MNKKKNEENQKLFRNCKNFSIEIGKTENRLKTGQKDDFRRVHLIKSTFFRVYLSCDFGLEHLKLNLTLALLNYNLIALTYGKMITVLISDIAI